MSDTFIAALVAAHGADKVRDAITALGPEISAAKSPRHYLGAVLRNGVKKPKETGSKERTLELLARDKADREYVARLHAEQEIIDRGRAERAAARIARKNGNGAS